MAFDFTFDVNTVKPLRHYALGRREGVVRPISDFERFQLTCPACRSRRVIRSSKAMRIFRAKAKVPCACGKQYIRAGAFRVAEILSRNYLAGFLTADDPGLWWQQQGLSRVLQHDGTGPFSVPKFLEWLEHHAPTVLKFDWVSVLRAYLLDIEQPASRLNLVQAVMVDGRQTKPPVNQDPVSAETFAKTSWFGKYMAPPSPKELAASRRRRDLQEKKLPDPSPGNVTPLIWLQGNDFYARPLLRMPEVEPVAVTRCLQDIRRAIATAVSMHLEGSHPGIRQYLDRTTTIIDTPARLIAVGYRGALMVHRLAGVFPELYERALALTDMAAREMLNEAAKAVREREEGAEDPIDPFPGCSLANNPGTCIGSHLLDLRIVKPPRMTVYACECRELHLVPPEHQAQLAKRPDVQCLCKDCGKPLLPASAPQVLSVFPSARGAAQMTRAA